MKTIVLLAIANVFMTFAWYWHLRLENVALWKVVLISWGIAGIEYWFQVPANRIGTHQFNDFQLKLIQECLSLTVFCVFAVTSCGALCTVAQPDRTNNRANGANSERKIRFMMMVLLWVGRGRGIVMDVISKSGD